MSPFTGLSAFPITPADASGRVDVAALRRLVARLAAAGVDSVGLLGSTGSYPYLTREERRQAIDAAREELGGRVPLLVGVGALRTDAAVALAQDARDAGADAGLLAPVSYTPLLDNEVFAHFEAVAAVGLPLCIYNNPGTTHFTFSPALTARLSRVPGIAAVKNPAPEAAHVAADIAGLRTACAPGFRVGYAIDARAAEAMLAGADTWYSVAAGLFPTPCAAIVHAVRAGDAAEARRINATLQPLWDLCAQHTSLRVMFAAASHLGLCHAAPPLPIQPLGPNARRHVSAVIEALGLVSAQSMPVPAEA